MAGTIARGGYPRHHSDPAVFHAVNLICHLLASFLVWDLRRSLRSSPVGPRAAAAGALLFGLHPLQVEPWGGQVGLKDVLSGVFARAALLLYVIALEKNDESSACAARWTLFTLATLAYGAAPLAKPSTVCVPLMALVIDQVLFRRPWKASLPLIGLWTLMRLRR